MIVSEFPEPHIEPDGERTLTSGAKVIVLQVRTFPSFRFDSDDGLFSSLGAPIRLPSVNEGEAVGNSLKLPP